MYEALDIYLFPAFSFYRIRQDDDVQVEWQHLVNVNIVILNPLNAYIWFLHISYTRIQSTKGTERMGK